MHSTGTGCVIHRTLAGTATWDDVTGGTFTITNLGAFEIDAFTPLINPPESAILGIGRIHEKPVGGGWADRGATR